MFYCCRNTQYMDTDVSAFYSSYNKKGGTIMSIKKRLFCLAFGTFGIYVGYKSAEVGWQYALGAVFNVDPTTL